MHYDDVNIDGILRRPKGQLYSLSMQWYPENKSGIRLTTTPVLPLTVQDYTGRVKDTTTQPPPENPKSKTPM